MVSINLFCEHHNISYMTVMSRKWKGDFPDHLFAEIEGETFIDEKGFVRRYEFKRRVVNEAHAFYFYFTKYFKPNILAYMMHRIDPSRSEQSWNMFLSKTLFFHKEFTILNYRIPGMLWEFYRRCRWLMLYFTRKVGLPYKPVEELNERVF